MYIHVYSIPQTNIDSDPEIMSGLEAGRSPSPSLAGSKSMVTEGMIPSNIICLREHNDSSVCFLGQYFQSSPYENHANIRHQTIDKS